MYTWPVPSKNSVYKTHVSLFKCFDQTHESIFPAKYRIMEIRIHVDATMLFYKYVAVYL